METEKDVLDEIELRSEGVQDILTAPPHWIIRWGNTVILAAIGLVLLMSYFIKYPEFIAAPIMVTSQNPPQKIVARNNSRIAAIRVKDHQSVSKGDILMIMESTGDMQDVIKLKAMVDSTRQLSTFPLSAASTFKLGELQSDFNNFAKALLDEQLFGRLKPYSPEDRATAQSLSEARAQIATLKQQLELENAKLDLARKNYERSQSLYRQGVIAQLELENEKISFLQAQQNVKNIGISISQLQGSIATLSETRSGTAINQEKDKINYSSQSLQLFEQLRRALRAWEQNYLIVSQVNGTVSFQQLWSENRFVNAGEILVSVLPTDKKGLVGQMSVAAGNSGKIENGQKVLIKLDNFPYQEFGIVEGRVLSVATTPDDKGNYYVSVILPHGLETSYNRKLPFTGELRGNAEIVTKDLRLIERFFYQIRQLLGHQA